jgi:hypothetical protein
MNDKLKPAECETVAWVNKRCAGNIEWNRKFDLPNSKELYTTPQPCPRCAELEQDLQTNADALAEVEQIRLGLQNCRLFAARHRNEDWALLILGFCAEAGEVGSITR